MNTVLLPGDCLEWIPQLPAQSIDLICADLPYGKLTRGRMRDVDKMLPIADMWNCFRHVLKPSGVVVMMAVQPFTSRLVMSNLNHFRYEMIWHRTHTGFLNANRQPLRNHENIL